MSAKIGLEMHVQLNAQSKMFCGCRNLAGLKEEPEPNSLTCPVCLGMPGSKPATNSAVLEMGLKAALALSSKVVPEMFFSRKTYFYPDNPKNFQITQYDIPLGNGGHVSIRTGKGGKKVRLKRLHVEEDAAKVMHVGGMVGGKHTLIDYNRSGVPVLEIVTEPDFSEPGEVRAFIQKLVTIFEYLGIYDSSKKAVIKTDANVSVQGGERVEVKEITGAKEIERALKYEIIRQLNVLKRGLKVERETRAWNADMGATQSVRGKEAVEEYGYIFEPDLTVVEVPGKRVLDIRKRLPESPDEKYRRFVREYRIPEKVAESIVTEIELADLFEDVSRKVDSKLAGTWISGYLKKTLNWNNMRFRESGVKPEWIMDLLRMFREGKITDRNAEMAVRKMVEKPEPPGKIVKEHGLLKGKIDLGKAVKDVVGKNRQAVEDYRRGEGKALHFLVGQVMREVKGQADAEDIRKAILKVLK